MCFIKSEDNELQSWALISRHLRNMAEKLLFRGRAQSAYSRSASSDMDNK